MLDILKNLAYKDENSYYYYLGAKEGVFRLSGGSFSLTQVSVNTVFADYGGFINMKVDGGDLTITNSNFKSGYAFY